MSGKYVTFGIARYATALSRSFYIRFLVLKALPSGLSAVIVRINDRGPIVRGRHIIDCDS